MASLKYFQCLLVQLVPAAGQIVQGLVVLVSVVWQLANPFLRLIASIIMFVFGLFSAVGGAFDLVGLVGDFVGIFTSLSSVFVTGPVIPQQVNFRRETRDEFRMRSSAILVDTTNTSNAADVIRMFLGLVWDYYTGDCMGNFTECACRNLDINKTLCEEVRDQHRRGVKPRTGPVLSAVAATMQGDTFCDHHLRSFEGAPDWEGIWPSDKAYYVECLDKVTRARAPC